MPLQDLGIITTKQRMVGVKLVSQDANGNVVSNFGTPVLTADQASAVSFQNLVATSDLPANSTFTVDIVAGAVSTGPVTITATGQQGNFQPHFAQQFQLTVVLDPSTPGPPTQFAVTAGSIVAQ